MCRTRQVLNGSCEKVSSRSRGRHSRSVSLAVFVCRIGSVRGVELSVENGGRKAYSARLGETEKA